MTTYADFQAYYSRRLWRTGDAEFATDLPHLIREAEARISRDLRNYAMVTSASASITSGNTVALPGDFKEIVHVDINGNPAEVQPFSLVTDMLNANLSDTAYVYAVLGDSIHLANEGTVEAPLNIAYTYQMGIAPYSGDPVAPFYDKHPDFYIAALDIYARDYLRDFELSQKSATDYAGLLESMERDSNYAKYPSGQLPTTNTSHR